VAQRFQDERNPSIFKGNQRVMEMSILVRSAIVADESVSAIGDEGSRAELVRQEMVHRGKRSEMDEGAIELMLKSHGPSAEATDSDAWDLGQEAADFLIKSDVGRDWLAGLPSDLDERAAHVRDFVDLTLDPMQAANMFWAVSPIAATPESFYTFAASYRAAVMAAVQEP
jgi:hypothetical protein